MIYYKAESNEQAINMALLVGYHSGATVNTLELLYEAQCYKYVSFRRGPLRDGTPSDWYVTLSSYNPTIYTVFEDPIKYESQEGDTFITMCCAQTGTAIKRVETGQTYVLLSPNEAFDTRQELVLRYPSGNQCQIIDVCMCVRPYRFGSTRRIRVLHMVSKAYFDKVMRPCSAAKATDSQQIENLKAQVKELEGRIDVLDGDDNPLDHEAQVRAENYGGFMKGDKVTVCFQSTIVDVKGVNYNGKYTIMVDTPGLIGAPDGLWAHSDNVQIHRV